MKSVISLGHLLWRPASLAWAIPLFFAITGPPMWFPEFVGGSPTVQTQVALWSSSIVVMGLLGALLSGAAREAHQHAFAFVVPAMRSSLLRGKLIVGIGIAFVIALAMLSTGDASESAAVFGCGLMYFAIATAMTDPASPPIAAPAGFVIFAVSVFQPHLVRTLFGMAPVIAAVGSAAIAFLLLRSEWSIDAARSRAIQPVLPERYRYVWPRTLRRAYVERRDLESADWRASPATGRMRDWVAAAHYEVFGGSRYGWLITLGYQAVFFAGAAFALGNPALAGLMGLLWLSWFDHHLSGKWPYPIARERRASLIVVCNIIYATAYAAVATATFWILDLSGLPQLPIASAPEANYPGVAIIAVVMLWAPLTQGAVVMSPLARLEIVKSPRSWILLFAHAIAVVVLSHVTYRVLARLGRENSLALAFLAAGALAVVVQAAYWLILRRHFARRDLA